MRAFRGNPRLITERRLRQLRDNLSDLGDLSGIVENVSEDAAETAGQICGGHQRLRAMFGERAAGEFAVTDADVEITRTYDPPTPQGTVADGYIIWRGGRYAYRRVVWDDATFRRANFVANAAAGQYDWDVFANTISTDDLSAWGVDTKDWLWELNADAGAVREMTQADKEIEFHEYDESIADGVTICRCQVCGNEHAKKN